MTTSSKKEILGVSLISAQPSFTCSTEKIFSQPFPYPSDFIFGIGWDPENSVFFIINLFIEELWKNVRMAKFVFFQTKTAI